MKVYLAGRPRYADNFKAAGFDYYRLESYYYIGSLPLKPKRFWMEILKTRFLY